MATANSTSPPIQRYCCEMEMAHSGCPLLSQRSERQYVPTILNRDGKMDLALVNTGGTVSIFLGAGDGTFKTGPVYNVGVNPNRAVVSDFNGDGKPDIAVLSGTSNGNPAAVWILLGNGDGTFQGPASTFQGMGPYFDITTADFNGDGIPDLGVPYELLNTDSPPLVAILLGNGDGTFRPPMNTAVEANGNPFAVGAADFNGDGKPDLVVAGCCGAADMMYFAGNGDGTFLSGVHFSAGPSPRRIAVGDLNGDGAPDLLISNNAGVAVLLNSASAAPRAIQRTRRTHLMAKGKSEPQTSKIGLLLRF